MPPFSFSFIGRFIHAPSGFWAYDLTFYPHSYVLWGKETTPFTTMYSIMPIILFMLILLACKLSFFCLHAYIGALACAIEDRLAFHLEILMQICWDRVFLGSISNYCVQYVKCPVLVVRKTVWRMNCLCIVVPKKRARKISIVTNLMYDKNKKIVCRYSVWLNGELCLVEIQNLKAVNWIKYNTLDL